MQGGGCRVNSLVLPSGVRVRLVLSDVSASRTCTSRDRRVTCLRWHLAGSFRCHLHRPLGVFRKRHNRSMCTALNTVSPGSASHGLPGRLGRWTEGRGVGTRCLVCLMEGAANLPCFPCLRDAHQSPTENCVMPPTECQAADAVEGLGVLGS